MFFKTLKRKQKYLEIITMKSPKISGKRNTKFLRRNPLRRANRKSNNNIDTGCNKTNAQSRTPLRTVYRGSVTKTSERNGCYSLSMPNSRKRRNESEEIPPSKRRKTINLCETIVLSDDDDDDDDKDDDDDDGHDNANNNDRKTNLSTVRTKLSRCHETSDIILLSPSPKITRKTRKIRIKSIKNTKKATNHIQSTKKPDNNNDSKDGDEVCVIWSSACEVPTEIEAKSEQVDDHNGEKYYVDNIGDESNFFKRSLFSVNTVTFTDQKGNEKEYSNNNSAVNMFSSSHKTPQNELTSRKLREIIVDGLNVTYGYTRKKKIFSKKGLQLVLDYFRSRGHDVKIFIPQYERSREREFLEDWYREGYVIFTPSRRIAGKKIISHDDRFILDYATKCKGIVVSSDQYRDLWKEKPEWRETIEFRLLPPTFAGDYVMFPEDPLGRSGPRLDEFLRH